MKDFVSSRKNSQSMYCMSTISSKDKIHGVRVPKFKLAYICVTTHPSHKKWLKFVVNYIICGGEINISQIKQESFILLR